MLVPESIILILLHSDLLWKWKLIRLRTLLRSHGVGIFLKPLTKCDMSDQEFSRRIYALEARTGAELIDHRSKRIKESKASVPRIFGCRACWVDAPFAVSVGRPKINRNYRRLRPSTPGGNSTCT